MKKYKSPHMRLLMFCVLPIVTTSLWAQESTVDEEDVYMLSPFDIDASEDIGYLATNSNSGTRLNMAIKDVPLNLEVITSEFIEDTGATDLRESLRYSAGIVLNSQSDAFTEPDSSGLSAGANDPRGVTRTAGDSSVKMRGFVTDQVLREGFRRQYSVDGTNIDRVEVLRGPSALLYGVGNFGGVINFIPKKPIFDYSKTEIGMAIGSYGLYRGYIDNTGPLVSEDSDLAKYKPAYRVIMTYQQKKDYTQFYNEKHWSIAPSFSFKPTPKTTVLFESEIGDKSEYGVGFQSIRSNAGSEISTASRDANWVTDIWSDQEPYEKIGSLVDKRTFRWSGKDTYLKGPFRNYIFDVEHRLSDYLILKVGVGRSETTFDSRQVIASLAKDMFLTQQVDRHDALTGSLRNLSTQEQNSTVPEPEEVNNATIAYKWKDYEKDETRDQLRAELAYDLYTNNWGDHNFLIGIQTMEMESIENEYGPGYTFTDGSHYVSDYDAYSFKNPYDLTPFVYGTQGDGLADAKREHLHNYNTKTWDMGYYLAYQGKFFKDKLQIVGGIRYDRSDSRKVTKYVWETTKEAEEQTRIDDEAPNAWSPQVGLSYAITDEISLFAVYSQGIKPNYYDYDGNGNAFAPTKAINYEVGVKMDLFDGKVSGTVSAYKIERTGVPKYIWWAPSPYQSIKNGWDPDAPSATVLYYATPDAMWYGIHNSDYTVAEATAIAKKIWPKGWWGQLDVVANAEEIADAWNYTYTGSDTGNNNVAGDFWTIAGFANSNTDDPNDTSELYYPLIDFSDPDVGNFMATILDSPGWWGNMYYNEGYQYKFGDGSKGLGNAPEGSGASIEMDDEAVGFDANFIISATDYLQFTMNYSFLDRKITTDTYNFVSAPYWPAGWWYKSDENFGTYNSELLAVDVYDDVQDTTTYHATIPDYNQRGDDSPKHTASLWMRYDLSQFEPLKGFAIGGGGYWESKRQWMTGFSGGGSNIIKNKEHDLVILYTEDRLVLNLFAEYTTTFADKYDVRFAINLDNLLDDEKSYGNVYYQGRTVKFSTKVSF